MMLSRCLLLLAALLVDSACLAQTLVPPSQGPAISQPAASSTDLTTALGTVPTQPSLRAPAAAPHGEDTHVWTLIGMPMVLHWEYAPEHRHAFGIALERRDTRDDMLFGFSLFRNSFGQPSAYAYVGKRWDNVWGNPNLSFKLTGGLLYGYVGRWQDRVPFNRDGYSPCIIPVLLYHLDKKQTIDLMVLGVGGLGFSYSYDF